MSVCVILEGFWGQIFILDRESEFRGVPGTQYLTLNHIVTIKCCVPQNFCGSPCRTNPCSREIWKPGQVDFFQVLKPIAPEVLPNQSIVGGHILKWQGLSAENLQKKFNQGMVLWRFTDWLYKFCRSIMIYTDNIWFHGILPGGLKWTEDNF